MAKIGVQGMMLKDRIAAEGVFATLKAVTELGYQSIEISQVAMTPENVAEMKRAKDELGMEFAAISAPLEKLIPSMDALATDYDKIVADARLLGAEILRIPMLPFPAMASKDLLLHFVGLAAQYSTQLKSDGLSLVFHNHHAEFSKFDGRTIMQIMRDAVPDLRYEVDVHWVHRAGVNPVTFLHDYAGMVDLIHLKDYRVGNLPPESLELLQTGDIAGFMTYFTGIVQFAEVGEGNLDFPAIIDAALSTGVQHLLVEQDDLYGRDALDCLKTSRDNLLAMGYGSLF